MDNKSKSESKAAVMPDVFGPMRDLQSTGLGSASKMGTAWFQAMSDLGSEFLSFMADRVKEDVKTQHEILHAKDVAEVQKIQAEFIQKAVDQYSIETGKLVELNQSALAKLPGTVIMSD